MNEFGKYLKYLRELKGISITELGELSGVSPSYISQIEKGGRRVPLPHILRKLVPHLGIGYYEVMVKAGYFDPSEDPIILDDDSIKVFFASLTEAKKTLLRTIEDFDEDTITSINHMLNLVEISIRRKK